MARVKSHVSDVHKMLPNSLRNGYKRLKTSQIALTDLSLVIQMPYGPIRTDAASDEKSFVREFRISVIFIFFFLFVFFFIFSSKQPRASLTGGSKVSDFHTKLLHGQQRCASALSELPLSALGKLGKTADCFER